MPEGGRDGERGVEAAEDGAEEEELAHADVHGQAGQVEAQRGQVAVGVQRAHALQAVDGGLRAGGRERVSASWQPRKVIHPL